MSFSFKVLDTAYRHTRVGLFDAPVGPFLRGTKSSRTPYRSITVGQVVVVGVRGTPYGLSGVEHPESVTIGWSSCARIAVPI